MSKAQTLQILHQAVVAGGGTPAMELYLRGIMHAESGGNRHAAARTSSAKGLFQFIDSTWAAYGGGDVWDEATQCRNVVRLAKDNARSLERVLGHEPDAGDLYLAHFAGPAGAKAVLRADSETPIRDIPSMRSAIGPNANIKYRGKRFADFTAGDLRTWAAAKMNVDVSGRLAYDESPAASGSPEEMEERRRRRRILIDGGMSEESVDTLDQKGGLFGAVFIALLASMFGSFAEASAQSRDVVAPAKPHDVTMDPGIAAALPATRISGGAEASAATPLASPLPQVQRPAAAVAVH